MNTVWYGNVAFIRVIRRFRVVDDFLFDIYIRNLFIIFITVLIDRECRLIKFVIEISRNLKPRNSFIKWSYKAA